MGIAEIEALLQAGATGFWIITHEEQRILPELLRLADNGGYRGGAWSAPTGLRVLGSTEQLTDKDEGLAGALDWAYSKAKPKKDEKVLLILHDPHELLTAGTTRVLREILMARKIAVLITTPKATVPLELEQEVQKIQYSLPKVEELVQAFRDDKMERTLIAPAADAAIGLTINTARIIVRRAVQRYGSKPREVAQAIWDHKTDRWAETGFMVVNKPTDTLAEIGGCENLKNWIAARQPLFETPAKERTIPTPKGLLFVGPAGTGKSKFSRAIAHELNRRFIEWNLGRVMGPYVGMTEEQTRRMLELTDRHQPAVVKIDEIAHQFAGHESSGYTDSGVQARLVGSILTYMEERTSDLLFAASTNMPHKLPPHLLRAGRFDNIWYFGLPKDEILESILEIHIKKYTPNSLAELNLRDLAHEMYRERYAGAEAEQAIIAACQMVYPKTITMAAMGEAMKHITPAAVSMKEEFKKIEEWAQERAIPVDGELTR